MCECSGWAHCTRVNRRCRTRSASSTKPAMRPFASRVTRHVDHGAGAREAVIVCGLGYTLDAGSVISTRVVSCHEAAAGPPRARGGKLRPTRDQRPHVGDGAPTGRPAANGYDMSGSPQTREPAVHHYVRGGSPLSGGSSGPPPALRQRSGSVPRARTSWRGRRKASQ